MRTWMRRGIPAAVLAGGVLAMAAGPALAAPAPIGDPTGVADTALKLADIVGHKGLPPLPDTSQVQLPAMPIGQQQRDLDPQGLPGGGLSLSNVQLNGQDLPALGSGQQQRDIDPSHLAVSDVPQLGQLPKIPAVGSGLPISVLPNVTTSRSLPNVTYAGQVPTGGPHDLTQLPDLTSLPLLGGQERALPGVGDLPLLNVLGGLGAQRSLPDLPALPALPAVPGASVNGIHGLPMLGSGFETMPAGADSRALPTVPGTSLVSGLLGAAPKGREIVPGVPSTAGVLGGPLGHAPRLPISGI
jgi:hypothetical protein